MDGELGGRRRFAQRQAELLSSGRFDVTSVEDYIDRYRDRFWLTGPPAGLPPFAQDPTLAALEMQPVAKLVATWASGNNPALGPHSPVAEIDNASAARWLLIAHGYSAGGIYTGRVADQPGRQRATPLAATGQFYCPPPGRTHWPSTPVGGPAPAGMSPTDTTALAARLSAPRTCGDEPWAQ